MCVCVCVCAELDPEEREELQKQIQQLKDELASIKSGSVLGDQQPKDIVRKCMARFIACVYVLEDRTLA